MIHECMKFHSNQLLSFEDRPRPVHSGTQKTYKINIWECTVFADLNKILAGLSIETIKYVTTQQFINNLQPKSVKCYSLRKNAIMIFYFYLFFMCMFSEFLVFGAYCPYCYLFNLFVATLIFLLLLGSIVQCVGR